MPFQVGAENFELSFQGKSVCLAVVPIAGIWHEVDMQDGSREDVHASPRIRVLLSKTSSRGRGSQWSSGNPCSVGLAPTHSSYVTLGAALGLSRPQFSHL